MGSRVTSPVVTLPAARRAVLLGLLTLASCSRVGGSTKGVAPTAAAPTRPSARTPVADATRPLRDDAGLEDAGRADPSAPPVSDAAGAGCVRNPTAHATQMAFETSRASIREALGRTPRLSDLEAPGCAVVQSLADLNGDGMRDRDVSLCLPPGGHVWDHYVYFSNGGCPRFAGHLVNAELTPLDERHHGVKDLESVAANGCAGNDFTWTLLRWDGSAYRVADTATCELCTDSWAPKPGPGANAHPYCKREIARRRADAP